jgi:hypothetical protein
MQREHTPQRPSIRHLLLGSVSRMVYSATHEVEGISRFEESGSSRLQRFDVFTQPRPRADSRERHPPRTKRRYNCTVPLIPAVASVGNTCLHSLHTIVATDVEGSGARP